MGLTTCRYCDPRFYDVYGFCGNCGRRCKPPMIGQECEISEYMAMRRAWEESRESYFNFDCIKK